MRISDWSSDVCSSDLGPRARAARPLPPPPGMMVAMSIPPSTGVLAAAPAGVDWAILAAVVFLTLVAVLLAVAETALPRVSKRSEERRVGKECVRKCRSRWSQYH